MNIPDVIWRVGYLEDRLRRGPYAAESREIAAEATALCRELIDELAALKVPT